jgi:hypothetical protein
MESASPPQKLRKDPCATFIRTDGVLLEVRNWKVEYCIWSLVATTSHILALKLTASWELLIRSIPLLFWVTAWLPLIVLAYHSLWTKCTPWFTSIIEPYHGSLLGARVSLISSEYPTWRRSTLKPCGHDLNRPLIYPSCPNIPEKIIF